MFNSPLEYCPHCRQYVALDSTPTECAAWYQCGIEFCPLQRHFTVSQLTGLRRSPDWGRTMRRAARRTAEM